LSERRTWQLARDMLSFVIPIKNEEESIVELYRRIEQEVACDFPFEVILVDDGSSDNSWNVIDQLARGKRAVRGLRLQRNLGKSAALRAGFREARGSIIFTLDGDLQDDPHEIRRFIDKLRQGFDLVSGWKKIRHDPWHKVLPSRVFNRMISQMGGVALHDHNCGFKCYRAEVAKSLTLCGDMHRMIPSLAAMRGYRAGEIEVCHHPRLHGHSKYGVRRFARGFFDMFTIFFLRHFSERPAHFCGGVGGILLAIGLCFLATGAAMPLSMPLAFAALFCGAALVAGAPILWTLGLLGELLIRGGLRPTGELPLREVTPTRSGTD
jgi:dolichol-phosphate mannosyltransferase